MKVLHRDVKLANILVHFKGANMGTVMNKKKWDEQEEPYPASPRAFLYRLLLSGWIPQKICNGSRVRSGCCLR